MGKLPSGFKTREEYNKYMREYRVREKELERKKEEISTAQKEILLAQKAFGDFLQLAKVERNLTQRLEAAKDSLEELYVIWYDHLSKQAKILRIPEAKRFQPYFKWVQERDQILIAIGNYQSVKVEDFLKRAEAVLGSSQEEEVKQHV